MKLNCSAKQVFNGWLNEKVHSEYTGGAKALINANEGGSFSAWDGYITGKILEIFPYKKIIQTWRTTDFSDKDEDSLIEISFTAKDDYTLMSISHSRIPDGTTDKYKKGWKDYYFNYMKKYYEK